jgi:hypothetical protein
MAWNKRRVFRAMELAHFTTTNKMEYDEADPQIVRVGQGDWVNESDINVGGQLAPIKFLLRASSNANYGSAGVRIGYQTPENEYDEELKK